MRDRNADRPPNDRDSSKPTEMQARRSKPSAGPTVGPATGQATGQATGRATGHATRSVYMTFPDEASAVATLAELLAERLIACANLIPAARSLYRWEGETVDESEVVVFAKTVMDRLPRLSQRVRELHPYDVPCMVALTIDAGNEEYLQWVAQETREGFSDG